MKFQFSNKALVNCQEDCLIVPVLYKEKNRHPFMLGTRGQEIDGLSQGRVGTLLKGRELGAALGDTLLLHQVPGLPKRVLLVNGGSCYVSPDVLYETLSQATQALLKTPAKSCLFCLEDILPATPDWQWFSCLLARICSEAAYRFEPVPATANKTPAVVLQKVLLWASQKRLAKVVQHGLSQGQAMANGMKMTRDLGNLPSNICTPSYLSTIAKNMAKKTAKLSVVVMGEKKLSALGMHAFMSVSKGSSEEGQCIILHYKGADTQQKPYVLVGKGITFDSGGISLKPGAAMDEMKYDMCGAATVFGVMQAILEMKAPINLVGLVAAAENMPSGQASKPGDVVTTLSGQTVEILNTDAEGRLVLCDVLTYAERFKPQAVIDIATLTGACIIAFGHQTSAVMSNQKELAQALVAAGVKSCDKTWELPIWDTYQKQLKSNFADMANIGGRAAGTITAGCFLSRFTRKYKWAHLDIAGVAWQGGDKKGATGRPVPLLVQYLLDLLQ